jgi:hypothetical protein
MKNKLILNYGLLIFPDNHGEIVSHCTTYTEDDVKIIEALTEPELMILAMDNAIELPQFDVYK